MLIFMLWAQDQLSIMKHRLIQDEPTRWNSSYYMYTGTLDWICAAEIECRVSSELSNQQWQLAGKGGKNIKAL